MVLRGKQLMVISDGGHQIPPAVSFPIKQIWLSFGRVGFNGIQCFWGRYFLENWPDSLQRSQPSDCHLDFLLSKAKTFAGQLGGCSRSRMMGCIKKQCLVGTDLVTGSKTGCLVELGWNKSCANISLHQVSLNFLWELIPDSLGSYD